MGVGIRTTHRLKKSQNETRSVWAGGDTKNSRVLCVCSSPICGRYLHSPSCPGPPPELCRETRKLGTAEKTTGGRGEKTHTHTHWCSPTDERLVRGNWAAEA